MQAPSSTLELAGRVMTESGCAWTSGEEAHQSGGMTGTAHGEFVEVEGMADGAEKEAARQRHKQELGGVAA